jgi:hypothetical protein
MTDVEQSIVLELSPTEQDEVFVTFDEIDRLGDFKTLLGKQRIALVEARSMYRRIQGVLMDMEQQESILEEFAAKIEAELDRAKSEREKYEAALGVK